MFGMISALYNGNNVKLVFFSKKDAENFKAFVNVYMARGGNGYGAYWVYGDIKIIGVDAIPEDCMNVIDSGYVNKMREDILQQNQGVCINMTFGQKNGAIVFNFSSSGPLKTVAKR